ncbi:MAG: co-chaperone GroES family protein [Candidatus Edwardsbacteria bacterium]|nr:co-chaperone GroES family protein [Candidatus Edwardsbacteria bacterium]
MNDKKQILMIGDRVLIDPDHKNDRTRAGLYLPPTVQEKDKVQTGYVVKAGPGYPLQDLGKPGEEPWSAKRSSDVRFLPLQVAQGDYALFLRDAAIEIEFENKKYLIVPYSAILAVVRTDLGL